MVDCIAFLNKTKTQVEPNQRLPFAFLSVKYNYTCRCISYSAVCSQAQNTFNEPYHGQLFQHGHVFEQFEHFLCLQE